jgi:SulP family sulfate permease
LLNENGNSDQRLMNMVFIAAGLGVIYLLPRLTKVVPSPLVAIAGLTIIAVTMDLEIPTVGDMGELPSALPWVALPDVPFNFETLKIVFPYALTLALVGLLESLLTAQMLDDMTPIQTRTWKREAKVSPTLLQVSLVGWPVAP